MPAGLAVKEERKTDHAPLVGAQENEVATLTATIETNLQQRVTSRPGGRQKGQSHRDRDGEPRGVVRVKDRQKSRADELLSRSVLRRSSSLLVRRFLGPCDNMDGCAQSRLSVSSLMLMLDHLTRDHTADFPLSNKCFVPAKCFSTATRCSASSASDLPRQLIWHPPRATRGPSGPPLRCLLATSQAVAVARTPRLAAALGTCSAGAPPAP